jgi:two-component system KDP operon response regulator KdpE
VTATPGGHTVLIVDDDPRLVRLVREVLTAAHFQVISRAGGEPAIEAAAVERPDLILLDIMLKDLDGYQVCRRVREFSEVPIIMLTAKVNEKDLLAGFDAGADDYITKPFSSKELLARVRAVIKRARSEAPSGDETTIVCGDVRIDLTRRRVSLGDRPVYLTATEYSLLHALAVHRDQVLLHEQLLTEVWGPEYTGDMDYLRSYVHHLRRKLERDPANPECIVTVQGVGYMLTTPGASPPFGGGT